MKLYTEEQVRKAIELSRDTHQDGKPYLERDEYDYSVDEVVKLLTSIELPSYEEIETKIENMEGISLEIEVGYRAGARWMLNKILNK